MIQENGQILKAQEEEVVPQGFKKVNMIKRNKLNKSTLDDFEKQEFTSNTFQQDYYAAPTQPKKATNFK